MTAKHYTYNAPDQKDGAGKWIKSFSVDSHKHVTRAGQLWTNMGTRCTSKFQERYPSYQGVSCGFKDFQDLAEWANAEQGYMDKDGDRFWQLDKDLLVPGNRIYAPDTCMFVPAEVNCLFNNSTPQDNGLMAGVQMIAENGRGRRFIAACRTGTKKSNHIGTYNTEEEAHAAWLDFKSQHVRSLALKYSKYPKIVIGLERKMSTLFV